MVNSAHDKLTEKINGRTIGIMSHGKSIYELEHRQSQFSELDICWASFNYYDLMQDNILNKMNKRLDIALECAAGRTKTFELLTRIPRMGEYIQKDCLVLSTWRLMRTQYEKMGLLNTYEEFKDDIILCDNILGILNVPNSLSLLIYTVAVCKPKQIILFGVDGYKKTQGDEFSTYFKPDLQKEYRKNLLGGKLEYTLHETTDDFEKLFLKSYEKYCDQFHVDTPKIYNCSPGSHFKSVNNLNYTEVLKKIK